MAKHVTDEDVKEIVEILDAWPLDEKLTWEKLCEVVGSQLEFEKPPTRQTLQKFVRIKNAFLDVKNYASEKYTVKKKKPLPASLKIAAKRIETLERQNERLEKENRQLLEQFVTWQYNAYRHGLKIEMLNMPLPEKDNQ